MEVSSAPHRSAGNLPVLPTLPSQVRQSAQGVGAGWTPRTPRRQGSPERERLEPRGAPAAAPWRPWPSGQPWWGPLGALAALLGAFLFGARLGSWQAELPPADVGPLALPHHKRQGPEGNGSQGAGSNGTGEQLGVLAQLSEERLQNITSNLALLQGLHQVVAKADDTYEEVYHKQLVRYGLDSLEPGEKDWNSFVVEARTTGPVFLEGKECLRDAVANMQRLIRRAPDYLRSLVRYLREDDADEAGWYLSKVVKLVDTIKDSMERAGEKFGQVDVAVGGMSLDARENEQHLEKRASRLIGEARSLAAEPLAHIGSWTRESDVALHGCQLGKVQASLGDCKLQCVSHESEACTLITYYKTSTSSNCYFHCESAARRAYGEADVFVLERAPAQVAADLARKSEVGHAAEELQGRWRSVQAPLGEVTRLVRRFRLATTDLRKSLEDVRFASGDLQTAVAGSSAEHNLRLLERRVGDLVNSIEDLGDSLAPLRFQRSD